MAGTINGGELYDRTAGTFLRNRVTDHGGAVGGGWNNQAGDDSSDLVSAKGATVAGGYGNTASGLGSTVGGGQTNEASGSDSTISGGNGNKASGEAATVVGGNGNIAEGNYSFAAGQPRLEPTKAPSSGAGPTALT